MPPALANCVVQGRPYTSKTLSIDVKLNENIRFLEIKSKSPIARLTAREGEIVVRYAGGETYLAISAALSLSPATVRNHISHCFKKLGVKNKAELANLLSSKRQVDPAGG